MTNFSRNHLNECVKIIELLDDSIIEKMIKDSERFSEKDKLVKEKIESKNNLECYISASKNSLENPEIKIKLGEEKFAEIYIKIQEVENWLEEAENLPIVTKEDFNNKYKYLEDYLLPIFKNVMT